MKSKKALSQVVGTVVLIMITVAIIGGVWGFINTFVSDKLEDASACKDVFDKVSLNSQYTCYNTTDNTTLISIKIGDLDVDGILVAVGHDTDSTVFIFDNETTSIADLTMYGGGAVIIPPKKESTKTYVLNNSKIPTSVEISPKMGKKQCQVTDSLSIISSCL